MGYFSNGMDGDIYFEMFCEKCAHESGCPVWELHMMWNYDATGNDANPIKREVLNSFIPREKDGQNKQCVMFTPKVESQKSMSYDEEVNKLKAWNTGTPIKA